MATILVHLCCITEYFPTFNLFRVPLRSESLSSGCHNKIPYTGQINQQKLVSHSSVGWEVQDQDEDHLGEGPLPVLQISTSFCVLTWLFLRACVRGEQAGGRLSGVFLEWHCSHHTLMILSHPPYPQWLCSPNTITPEFRTLTSEL